MQTDRSPLAVRAIQAPKGCPLQCSFRRNTVKGNPSGLVNRKSIVVASTESRAALVDVESLPLPEGKYGLPVVGEQLEAFKNPEFVMDRLKTYGPIFKTRYLGANTVFICGLDNIQEAMSELSNDIVPWDTWALKTILGEKAMVRLNGDEHIFVRKAAYPAFNGTAVEGYIPDIAERAAGFLEKWAASDSVNFNPETKEFAFEVTAQSIVGLSYGEYTKEEVLQDFNTWWAGFFALPINLPFTKFGRTVNVRNKMGSLIQKNIEMAKNGEMSSKSALDIMVGFEDDEGRRVSDKQLEDTIFNFLMAGYDTTASAMTSTLLELARHPEVFARVRAEQEEVVSKLGSEVTKSSLDAMPYLEAVIKEAMRVTPVAHNQMRKANRTLAFKGFKIPKDWNVALSLQTAMKDLDERWPGDTSFNPDRFLTREGAKPGAYIPWGIGSHSCLGNIVAMVEMKILLALMARGYDFEVQNLDPEFTLLPMPEPNDGLPVTFKKISA